MKLHAEICSTIHPILSSTLNRVAMILLATMLSLSLRADNHQRSVALKDSVPQRISYRLKSDFLNDELWDAFMAMKQANAGDPVAEHELGLRYLLGKGFSADTQKAARWIQKAADQNLVPAQYNYGIMLNNGMGVEWNPFEAYWRFKYAATHHMMEAQYIYGLLMTDNLVVPRNYPEAYRWISVAADSGYEPAQEVLAEFRKRGINIVPDSVETNDPGPKGNHAIASKQKKGRVVTSANAADTTSEPDLQTLLKEAILQGGPRLKSVIQRQYMETSESELDSLSNRYLIEAADAGSPEALTVMGEWHTQGHGMKRDFIQAAFYYLRAVRLESPWASRLLLNLVRQENFFSQLKEAVDQNNATAQFVWAGLTAFGFDHQLTDSQALEFLQKASSQNFSPAIVELGLCYFTGTWVRQDRGKAEEVFRFAKQRGNCEAGIRLCMIELMNKEAPSARNDLVDTLRSAVENGSVLAQAMLGYCYQHGISVTVNKQECIRLYREAAQRGSTSAYNALRILYDEIRPNDREFRLPDVEVLKDSK